MLRLLSVIAMVGCVLLSQSAQAASSGRIQLRGHISNTQTYQSFGRLASDNSMQIVSDVSGNMFFYSANGSLQAIPEGTNIGALMEGGAGGYRTHEQRLPMWNPRLAREVMGPMTLTYVANDGSTPMEMCSRQYMVNGVQTYGGGSMIREYPSTRAESFARVYAKR